MLVHPLPNPVAFSIGPIAVHWYGLMYLCGFLFFIVLGRVRIKTQPHIARAGWVPKNLDDILFYGVFGVIVGGRLGEVLFYNPKYFFSHPMEIFAVWQGGMSYHGGFLGVLIAMWFWSRKNSRAFWDTMDFAAPTIPIGYACGRLGNFINAELPGRVASPDLPWAMIWPNFDMLPRHPSPLYQMLVDGLLMFVLLWLYARKERPRGAVSGMYCVLYGCARFFTEYFRIPDYEVNLGVFTISAGQMLSLPMIVFGLILLWWAYKTHRIGGDPSFR